MMREIDYPLMNGVFQVQLIVTLKHGVSGVELRLQKYNKHRTAGNDDPSPSLTPKLDFLFLLLATPKFRIEFPPID